MPKQTSKELIISAFRDLMEHEDFDSITTSEIINKSGISRATFYKHFADKYELLEFITHVEIINTCFFEVNRSVYDRELEVLRCFGIHRRFYSHAFQSLFFQEFWLQESIKSNAALLKDTGIVNETETYFTSHALGSSFAVLERLYLQGKLHLSEDELALYLYRMTNDLVFSALQAQKNSIEPNRNNTRLNS